MDARTKPLGFGQALAYLGSGFNAILDHGHTAVVDKLLATGDIDQGNMLTIAHGTLTVR